MGHHELSSDLMRARYQHALEQHRLHGQRELAGTIRRLVRTYPQLQGQASARGASSPGRKLWKALAELGLLRVAASDARMRPGPLVWMTIMEEFGRSLVAEPFVETVVAAGELILRLGSSSQRESLLPQIAGGEAAWAIAHEEPLARGDLNDVVATAKRFRSGYLVQGAKANVRSAPWADKFIVSARTSGARRDPTGVSLFVVDARNRGVRLDPSDAACGGRIDTLTLSNAYIEAFARLGEEGDAIAALESCRAKWIAALCAQAVGAIDGLIAIVRRNASLFGEGQRRPGRWNDMLAAHEDAVALTLHLSARLAVEGKAGARLLARTKSLVGDAARFVLDEASRFIDDGPDGTLVARYAQCICSINAQHGDPEFHLRKLWDAC